MVNNLFKNIILLLITITYTILLFNNCAIQSSPTGGKKDTLAPTLTKSIPTNKTINYKRNEIELRFSEYVNIENIQQQLLITPILEKSYETKIYPNGIKIKLKESLKENTTYNFDFREAVSDATEKNKAKNIRIVFSTGNKIDSLKIEGNIKDLLTNENEENCNLGLYDYTDSLNISKTKPKYFTKTDTNGNFIIENIANSKYKIYALKDDNNNLLYDEKNEKVGIYTDTVDLKNNLNNINIKLVKAELIKNKIVSTKTTANYFFIEYAKGIKTVNIETENKDSITYQIKNNKTIQIFNTNYINTDTLKVNITVTDSLDNELKQIQKIKFKEKSKKTETTKEIFDYTIESNEEEIDFKDKGITIKLSKPIKVLDINKFKIFKDTVKTLEKNEYSVTQNYYKNEINIKTSKINKQELTLKIEKGALISIENDTLSTITKKTNERNIENYGTISGEIKIQNKNFIIELLDENYKLIDKLFNEKKYKFTYLKPNKYRIRLIVDANKNNKWDNINIQKNIEAESVYFINEVIKLKKNFDLTGLNIIVD